MYIHRLVVRWENGDLEGFSATAFDKKRAAAKARTAAMVKALEISSRFEFLTEKEFDALPADDKKMISIHWDLDQHPFSKAT